MKNNKTSEYNKTLTAINKAYLSIDFRNKTIFLDKKGNDITGNVLSCAEAEILIDSAINEELP